jgi:hypothetical protein
MLQAPDYLASSGCTVSAFERQCPLFVLVGRTEDGHDHASQVTKEAAPARTPALARTMSWRRTSRRQSVCGVTGDVSDHSYNA